MGAAWFAGIAPISRIWPAGWPADGQDRRRGADGHHVADRATASSAGSVDAHIDDSRLDNLYRIGVDEIAYKKGRKFLTVVTDHGTGNAIWIARAAPRPP